MEVSKQFQRLCQKQGLKFKLNTKVTAAKREGEKVKVTIEGVKDGKTEEVCFFYIYLLEESGKIFDILIIPIFNERSISNTVGSRRIACMRWKKALYS